MELGLGATGAIGSHLGEESTFPEEDTDGGGKAGVRGEAGERRDGKLLGEAE